MKFTAEDIQAGQILLVDKPLDWTSFNAVNKIKWKLKREFNLKKVKVGHAGTLDPRATGLLVICTGKATKQIPQIQDASKEYWAEIKIGVQTESYDTEKPEILPQDISGITEVNIQDALKKFLGEIDQKPPIFSALKVDGKRAYDLARAGQEVDIKGQKNHYSLYRQSRDQFALYFFLCWMFQRNLYSFFGTI
jgi:tRNA pseudouridine55 synthase